MIGIGPLDHQIIGVDQSIKSHINESYQGFIDNIPPYLYDKSLVICEVRNSKCLDLPKMRLLASGGWCFWNPLGKIETIDALDFIVALSPDRRHNRLYIQATELLLNRIVIENYLRIATAHLLLKQGGCLLHSGGFIHDGLAWLFVGISGAGKTTLTKIAHEGGATILSDDINVLFRDTEGQFLATPVPFAGEFGRQHNMKRDASGGIPVGGVYRIEKSDRLSIKPLATVSQHVTLLSNMPFVNNIPEFTDDVDTVVSALADRHPLQTLQFSKEMQFDELADGLEKSRMEQQHAA